MQKLLFGISLCFWANITLAQVWNQSHINSTQDFISKNSITTNKYGYPLEEDEKRVVLPGYRAITSIGNKILEIEWDINKTFSFYIDESQTFKANIFGGKELFRYDVDSDRIKEAIQEAEKILKKIANGKLEPLVSLFSRSDRTSHLAKTLFELGQSKGIKYARSSWLLHKDKESIDPNSDNLKVSNSFGKLVIEATIDGENEKIEFILERGPEYNVYNENATLPLNSAATVMQRWATHFGVVFKVGVE